MKKFRLKTLEEFKATCTRQGNVFICGDECIPLSLCYMYGNEILGNPLEDRVYLRGSDIKGELRITPEMVVIHQEYDMVNPNHYKQGDKETWEQMLEIWGKDAFIKHCEITAFKYIQRLGKKPNNSIEQDLEKARWYLNKAYDLKNN